MIPRYQKILFVILLIAALGMGFKLWQLRDRAHKRLLTGQTVAPTAAPAVAPAEQATLVVANDFDNSLVPQVHSLPLPADPGARARSVLGKLLDLLLNAGAPVGQDAGKGRDGRLGYGAHDVYSFAGKAFHQ